MNHIEALRTMNEQHFVELNVKVHVSICFKYHETYIKYHQYVSNIMYILTREHVGGGEGGARTYIALLQAT